MTASQRIFLTIVQLTPSRLILTQLGRKLQLVCSSSTARFQCIGQAARQCTTNVNLSENAYVYSIALNT